MTLCKYMIRVMIIGMVLIVSPVFGMQRGPIREEVPAGWGDKVAKVAGTPFAMINDNSEWFNLVCTLMQVPSILTLDSTDPQVIKLCASLAAASIGLKIISIASSNGQFMKIVMLDVPKAFCYFLSAGYDIIRILDAPKVVLKNNTDAKRLKFFKVTQLLQLIIEIVLRGIAIGSKNMPQTIDLATWLADCVSIWRLIERYKTYFISEIDMLEFNFGWKKSPASGIIEIDDEQEIEKLEAFAEALAAKHIDVQNNPEEVEEGPIVDEAT